MFGSTVFPILSAIQIFPAVTGVSWWSLHLGHTPGSELTITTRMGWEQALMRAMGRLSTASQEASHDTEGQEDAQKHQCHWQAFPSQQIPWHHPKAKCTALNKDFNSQLHPREEVPPAHLIGRTVSTPTKSKNMGQLF